MKIAKKLVLTFLSCLILLSFTTKIYQATTNAKTITNEQYVDTLRLLLYPYIIEEVQNIYDKYTHVDIYNIRFESIEIQTPANIFITVIIMPYTGPHNTVSIDKITLHVNSEGVTITNYEIVGS